MEEEIQKILLKAQKVEVSEAIIYRKLSKAVSGENKKILEKIADDEEKHSNIWKKYTNKDVKPYFFLVWFYYVIARVFGITFGLKLMEKAEERAQINYEKLSKHVKEAKAIEKEEKGHEEKLINLLKEEKLEYVGSIVLGLNDALVELTGALAGLTLALRNPKLIAIVGLITGIAASMSMAASEYLSIKSEKAGLKNPFKASVYTGIAYILVVLLLIAPYLFSSNPFVSLAWTLINAVLVILLFSFYVSVTKDLNFKKQFLEMTILSLSIAAVSFGIGFVIRNIFGVEV